MTRTDILSSRGLIAVVLNQEQLCPPLPTPGGLLLASGGEGRLLNILQLKGRPRQPRTVASNVHGAEVKNPSLYFSWEEFIIQTV